MITRMPHGAGYKNKLLDYLLPSSHTSRSHDDVLGLNKTLIVLKHRYVNEKGLKKIQETMSPEEPSCKFIFV